MKLIPPLLPARSLAILACLLALMGGLARAQSPVADRLDVFFAETKFLPLDRPIDDFSVTPDSIIKVTKVDGSPNQLAIEGMAEGSAMLTVKSDGRTLLYDVTVSPAPERLYINLAETKRLTFPNPIDDTSLTTQGIVKVVQPDTSDKILLLEAQGAGKTTLTVYSKNEIYRYIISTFENRGADILDIQNAFSAKGYRDLGIQFDGDQGIISGTVPTQEELDDAVRIVKQYTDYVVVKATLGESQSNDDGFDAQEQLIINNIQRIANVKGLTVRVKYPAPNIQTTTTYTVSKGDFIEPKTVTTPQGGVIRGGGFEPPKPDEDQGQDNGGPTEIPRKNTTQTVTTTINESIPEKVFLFGDMEDDLAEAKVLRVARTFCPFIVNFMTVKDPIQLRTQIRFMQVEDTGSLDTGVDWGTAGPIIKLGINGGFGMLPNPFNAFKNFITSPGSVLATINANAALNLAETLNLAKELQESDLFLLNGQPGWYSEGEVKTYVSNVATVIGTASTDTSVTTSQIFLGVNMDISPLNGAAAGAADNPGQQILGIPGGLGSGYSVSSVTGTTADKIGKLTAAIGSVGTSAIDSTTKYVDENGVIGMNISTQLSVPNGFPTATVGGNTIVTPDVLVRTTRTRVDLRDGQTVAIDGLIDKEITDSMDKVPFFSKIPFFSNLFKSDSHLTTNEQVMILVTPHIVRMRDPNSVRVPQPLFPEMRDLAREDGQIPIIKPVRYNPEGIDIRPESSNDNAKDMTNVNSPTVNQPLVPHATGGMESLQPAADTMAPRPVDKLPSAPDTSRQTTTNNATPTLAPSSTLP